MFANAAGGDAEAAGHDPGPEGPNGLGLVDEVRGAGADVLPDFGLRSTTSSCSMFLTKYRKTKPGTLTECSTSIFAGIFAPAGMILPRPKNCWIGKRTRCASWADFRVYAGIDLSAPRMHWWEFMAVFSSLPPDSQIKFAIQHRGINLGRHQGPARSASNMRGIKARGGAGKDRLRGRIR